MTSGTTGMLDAEVVQVRTYTVIVCPTCGRQAEGVDLRCFCADVFPWLEPVEVQAVALSDPGIIVPPDHARQAVRS